MYIIYMIDDEDGYDDDDGDDVMIISPSPSLEGPGTYDVYSCFHNYSSIYRLFQRYDDFAYLW